MTHHHVLAEALVSRPEVLTLAAACPDSSIRAHWDALVGIN